MKMKNKTLILTLILRVKINNLEVNNYINKTVSNLILSSKFKFTGNNVFNLFFIEAN